MMINYRFKKMINSRRPVLVHFYAEWCRPCYQLLPVLQVVKTTFKDQIRIMKVNVDHNPAIASQFRVRSLPTLILFQSGEIKWMTEGVMESAELTKILREFVS